MQKIYAKTRRLLTLLRFIFPSKLPTTFEEFDPFFQSIVKFYGLPDKPCYKTAVASIIMHLSPTKHSCSKFYFAKVVKKQMANEVAYNAIQEVRAIEKALQEAIPKDGKLLEPIQNQTVHQA